MAETTWHQASDWRWHLWRNGVVVAEARQVEGGAWLLELRQDFRCATLEEAKAAAERIIKEANRG